MLAPKPFATIGPHQEESGLGIFLSQVEYTYTRMSSDPSQQDVKKRFAVAQAFFLFSLCSVNLIANPNFGRTIIHEASIGHQPTAVTYSLRFEHLSVKNMNSVLFFIKLDV